MLAEIYNKSGTILISIALNTKENSLNKYVDI